MQRIKMTFVALATLGLILPQSMMAMGAELPAPIPDLALGQGDMLVGQVVDPQGKSLSGVVVTVLRGDREVVRTVTNQEGRFAVAGLNGGTYTISAQGSKLPCRVWVEGTAPPNAKSGVMLVSGELAARGHIGHWMSGDLLIATLGAAGLAAIVATAVTDNPSGS